MAELFLPFKKALEKFGTPELGEKLSQADFSAYRGRLPDSLLQFWEQYGLGVWMKGYFQFCNPEKYRSILKFVFGNDPEFRPERSHVIGFSAFGQLLVWNEDYRTMYIDMLYHEVLCHERFKPEPEISGDVTIGIAVHGVDDEANDPPDQNGNDLYKRTLKACGELAYGQIYALRLAPALGGAILVENFRPASALAAMAISAQTAPFELRDSTTPQVKAVRLMGME
ncbi:GAD-like domain-containing protein [Phyllobacterium sp. SB3]|uniref:GAD-like domain-containing protein n=1 Tax=Phyllobacterium sp. SB3 TaxID=3156073 RepID=UPI0032AF76E7